jgi:hypothetical protein
MMCVYLCEEYESNGDESVVCMTPLSHPRGGGGRRAAAPKAKFKKHRFCRDDDIKVLRDLRFTH